MIANVSNIYLLNRFFSSPVTARVVASVLPGNFLSENSALSSTYILNEKLWDLRPGFLRWQTLKWILMPAEVCSCAYTSQKTAGVVKR